MLHDSLAMEARGMAEKKKGYFYDREENALREFIQTTDQKRKNCIYNEILAPAFDKMISSIIRRYKLQVPDEEYEQTFNDTLTYLMSKVGNFKPDSGYKAYSYCGTVVRNYLKYKNTQYAKRLKRNIPIEDVEPEVNARTIYDPESTTFADDAIKLIEDMAINIREMIDQPVLNDLNANEVKVGRAICHLFENWQEILPEHGSNKMNKSSILYFLREETKMSTKELRDNMRKYSELYGILKEISNKEK